MKFQSSDTYEGIKFENVLKCIHCGLCLDSCPTYRESGLEQDSPRGRLYIMNGVWRGDLQFTPENTRFLDRCIDCRACETACPSKVPYGELIEKTRGILNKKFRKPGFSSMMQRLLYRDILPKQTVLKGLSIFFKLYEKIGVKRLLTSSMIKNILPGFIVKGQFMLPVFSGTSFKEKYNGVHTPKEHDDENETIVALFTGCIADVSDHDVHLSTLRLLLRANFSVAVIDNQTCCGALQVHGGDRDAGKNVASINIKAFNALDPDKIITNAGGCSAQLKEYHLLFESGEFSKTQLEAFESKIIDVLELLGQTDGFVENQQWNTSEDVVLYDAPCHLMHAQGVDKNPRQLINALPGVTLVPLTESEYCCGSGGIYNLLCPELADSILERKINSLKETLKKNPTVKTLVSGNPGCLFQLRYGIAKHRIPIRAIHPAVYVAERLLEKK